MLEIVCESPRLVAELGLYFGLLGTGLIVAILTRDSSRATETSPPDSGKAGEPSFRLLLSRSPAPPRTPRSHDAIFRRSLRRTGRNTLRAQP